MSVELVAGRPDDVLPYACCIALDRAAPVVVCLRAADGRPVAFPLPAGRRSHGLAARIQERGLEAQARGALVLVEVDEPQALRAIDAVAEITGELPVVALLRPRTGEDERLIQRSRVTVVEGALEPAVELFVGEMEGRGVPVAVARRRTGLAERLAGSGLRARWLAGDSGQASVEAVALMPLLLSVVVAAGQLLAAGAARELAGHAATAGAAALIQGRDAESAARRALPGWAAGRFAVNVRGRKVSVRVRPRGVPLLASALEARVSADAGPAP